MQNNGSMKKIVLLFGVLILAFALYSVVTSREAFWGNNYSSEQNSEVESNNTNAPDNNDNKAPAVDSEKNSVTESNKTNTSNSNNKKPSSAENKDNNSMDILDPDHDHIYELKVLAQASCGVEGKQAYVCVACGKQQYVTSIAALSHNYQYNSELSVASTCSSMGKTVEQCTNCGGTKEETFRALGHEWTDITTHDSNANELIIKTHCTRCWFTSTQTYQYKINDVVKLVVREITSNSLYGDLDYTYVSDRGYENVLKAPYYRVDCDGTYVFIVRNTKSFQAYSQYNSMNTSLIDFYKSQGCTVVYKARITADGRLQSV